MVRLTETHSVLWVDRDYADSLLAGCVYQLQVHLEAQARVPKKSIYM